MVQPPSNIVFEYVEKPTDEIAQEAVIVFAGVMSKDPAATSLSGGNINLIPDLGRAMVRPLALCPGVGQFFSARDETGALVGFTLFSLPGQLMCSTPEQQAFGLFDLMGKLSPEGQKYYAETMGKAVPAANDEVLGIEEAERSTYWCNFAMVREDYQGKGVAKTLFQLASKEAAKLGATMALTTTNIRNVPIYEKIGFKLYGERLMPSPWGDWPIWYFAKEP
ncbi:hypothetical protein C8Q76DRAFT_694860 [Earliella scabrosa]|nr:hypothetical protein C8Q76DRAFT_694860 [Earliella scabrosa]